MHIRVVALLLCVGPLAFHGFGQQARITHCLTVSAFPGVKATPAHVVEILKEATRILNDTGTPLTLTTDKHACISSGGYAGPDDDLFFQLTEDMEAIFSKEGEYNKNNGQQLLALPVYVKIVPAGSIAECRDIATPEAEEPQQEAEKAQPEAEKPPQPKLAFLGCGGVFTDPATGKTYRSFVVGDFQDAVYEGRIWAHEYSHTKGNPDLHPPSPPDRLMYYLNYALRGAPEEG